MTFQKVSKKLVQIDTDFTSLILSCRQTGLSTDKVDSSFVLGCNRLQGACQPQVRLSKAKPLV